MCKIGIYSHICRVTWKWTHFCVLKLNVRVFFFSFHSSYSWVTSPGTAHGLIYLFFYCCLFFSGLIGAACLASNGKINKEEKRDWRRMLRHLQSMRWIKYVKNCTEASPCECNSLSHTHTRTRALPSRVRVLPRRKATQTVWIWPYVVSAPKFMWIITRLLSLFIRVRLFNKVFCWCCVPTIHLQSSRFLVKIQCFNIHQQSKWWKLRKWNSSNCT